VSFPADALALVLEIAGLPGCLAAGELAGRGEKVVRMTSGVLTTHYTAIEGTLADNRIFVAYDLGGWSKGMNRDVFGRFVEVAVNRQQPP
jgi:hypothetical protein